MDRICNGSYVTYIYGSDYSDGAEGTVTSSDKKFNNQCHRYTISVEGLGLAKVRVHSQGSCTITAGS